MADKENPEEPKALVKVAMGRRGIELHSIEELYRFGQVILRSHVADDNLGTKRKGASLVPPTLDIICAAIELGLELGMGVMQAATSVVRIRGRLTLPGDTARALVEAHPTCEWIKDNAEDLAQVKDWTPDVMGIVSVKRTNRPEPITRRFSVQDAMTAGLWSQDGPWRTYRARMMYYRPLGFVLRDGCGDILKGLVIAEELRDYPSNGPVSGDTLPAKDLEDVTKILDAEASGGIPGLVTDSPEAYDEKAQEENLSNEQ